MLAWCMMDHTTKYSKALSTWYATPLGAYVKQLEMQCIANFISNMHGDVLVQVGDAHTSDFSQASSIRCQLQLATVLSDQFSGDVVMADSAALPLRPHSVDVILLPHVLAALPSPDDCLADVFEALAVGGHAVVMAYNPFGLLGLCDKLCASKILPQGHGHSRVTVRQCLWGLGFNVVADVGYFFRPPMQRKTWLQGSVMLDTLGQFLWPHTGAGYVMVAQKSSSSPMRVRQAPRQRQIAFALGGAPEPSRFDKGTKT